MRRLTQNSNAARSERILKLRAAALRLVALLSLLPSAAFGASFSVPLPDLVGVVGYPLARETSFEFGQQFSSIENVWIEVEARVFAAQLDVCGTIFNPQPCVHEVLLLGCFARLDKEDTPAPGTVFSNGLSFSDDSHALEGYGIDTAAFNERLGFDFLLDGNGSLTLFWNDVSGDPDLIIQNVILPSGEIFNASLVIEGTPIPEPSTALLVTTGLLTLARIRRMLVPPRFPRVGRTSSGWQLRSREIRQQVR